MRRRKFQFVLFSTGSFLLLTVLIFGGMSMLSYRAETYLHSYPWRNEDYLRNILPILQQGDGTQRLLLAGPSEAREAFIYQRMEKAFPGMRVYQGGQSLGTFDDLLLSLEYIEKVYGLDAVPQALVLGITPRFVANIHHGQSALEITFDRYSPYYSIEYNEEGGYLVEKSWWEGLVSRARFLPKQRGRFLSAVAATVNRIFDDRLPYEQYPEEVFEKMREARSGSLDSGILALLKYVREVGPMASVARLTKLYTSPYRYHHLAPLSKESLDEWLNDPDSFWYKVHAWNPDEDSLLIRRQFRRLKEIADRWNMQVYVVNLPEHPMNRNAYREGRFERYLWHVENSLVGIPFLNLREMFGAEAFYDVGHLNLESALLVTDKVISFMKAESPGLSNGHIQMVELEKEAHRQLADF